MPAYGGSKTSAVQRNSIWSSKMPQYLRRYSVSDLRKNSLEYRVTNCKLVKIASLVKKAIKKAMNDL